MARAVEQSRYTLVVLSSAYLQSNFSELESVLTEHVGLEESQRRLLVVSREPTRLRLGIRARLMLDMTNDEQFETGIVRLVQELHRPAAAIGLEVPDVSPRPGRNLTFEVVEGDIIAFAADLVAFEYAQGFTVPTGAQPQALGSTGIDVRRSRGDAFSPTTIIRSA